MDTTIEELEIIIKAKIDDALKGIKEITGAIKQKVKESTGTMIKLNEASSKVGKAMQPAVQEVKQQMKQHKQEIKKATDVTKQVINEVNKTTLKVNADDKSIQDTSDTISDLEAKISYLSKLKNISVFQTENLEKYKQQLEAIKGKVQEVQPTIEQLRSELLEEKEFEWNYEINESTIENLRTALIEAAKDIDKFTDNSIIKINELKNKMEEFYKSKGKSIDLNYNVVDVNENGKMSSNAKIPQNTSGSTIQNIDINTSSAHSKMEAIKGHILEVYLIAYDKFKSLGPILSKTFAQGIISVKKFINSVKSVKQHFDNIRQKASKTFSNVSNSISDSVKSIKRFALGLLSVRTAISVVSKAAQAYLNFDQSLSESIQNSWNMLGSLLAPALEYVASLFSKLVNIVATFVKALTGVDLVARANAKALDKQAKSAKNANNQMASIDDIDTLSSNSGNGSGDTPSISTSEVDITPFDKILSKIKEIIEVWKKGDWGEVGRIISDSITNAFDFLSGKIKSIDWSSIGSGMSDFLSNIDFSSLYTSWITIFGELILGLQELFLTIDWETILFNLSQGIIAGFSTINEYINQIEFSEIGRKLGNAFISLDWKGIGNSILNMMWSALSGITTLFLSIDWGEVGNTISEAAKGWLDNIIQKFKETDWVKLAKEIMDSILDFILNIDWFGLIGKIFNLLSNAIGALIGILTGALISLCGKLIPILINGAKEAWDGIMKVFSKVAEFFGSIFSAAWNAVKKVFSVGGKIFDGIKDGIVTAFKTIVNGIIKGINKVVAIPFKAINKVLSKINGIDILGVKPFKWVHTFDVPEIPLLATGNVAKEPTLAVFGEYSNAKNNPEITSPQSIMKETFRSALNEYGFSNNNEGQHITVNVAGENFVDMVVDEINRKFNRKGVSVFSQ